MAASSGSLKVWFYQTANDNVPCLVNKAYSAYTSAKVNTPTTVEGSIVFADILILANNQTKLYGVAVGTTTGTITLGN